MWLFYGSNRIVDKPSLSNDGKDGDFGNGFYLTPITQYAYEQAMKQVSLHGGRPVINRYEWNENYLRQGNYFNDVPFKLSYHEFCPATTEWLDYILDNRKGKDDTLKSAEVILAPSADYSLFPDVNLYGEGMLSMDEETLKWMSLSARLFVFKSERVVDTLKFLGEQKYF